MSILTTEPRSHRENQGQKDPRTGRIIGAAVEVHRNYTNGSLIFSLCLCASW